MPRYQLDVHADAFTRQKALAADVLHGLSGRPRRLLPKYFYDEEGSRLFDEITRLPEYYLTRVETALIDDLAPRLMPELAPDDVVELGAGFSVKTRRLLGARPDGRPLRYTPVDVDEATIALTARQLLRDHPGVEVHAVVGDFERHLVHVPPPRGRRLVLFLGSTLGNLDPPDRHALLLQVRSLVRPGDRFLLGIDLVKSPAVLEAAYDDAAGVTARFNRNILRVINRALDGDFDPERFRHHAWYNGPASRIEMHLVCASAHTVRLRALDLTLDLEAGERIWTESSYKFTRATAEAMLTAARFAVRGWHTDAEARFALVLAEPLPASEPAAPAA